MDTHVNTPRNCYLIQSSLTRDRGTPDPETPTRAHAEGERMSKLSLDPIRSRGRAKGSAALRDRIIQVTEESKPLSVRNLFYQLTNPRFVHVTKTELSYKRIVRLKKGLCEDGVLPWSAFTDATRYVIGHGSGYSGLNDDTFKDKVRELYRRDVWQNSGVVIQIWVEARSLAPTLSPIASEWGVDIYPAGGQPSDSFVYQSAAGIVNLNNGGRAVVLYVGDHDNSGRDIANSIETKLQARMVDYCKEKDWPVSFIPELLFRQLAVTESQIVNFDLPIKPARPSKSRHGILETVEAEAMHPDTLRAIFRQELEELMPSKELRILRLVEASERNDLTERLSRW